jgi:hypothetical protein
MRRTNEVHEVAVALDHDHFVDEGERTVQPFGIAIDDRQRLEALVARTFEDLQRRMRAQRGDRIHLADAVFPPQPVFHGFYCHRHTVVAT